MTYQPTLFQTPEAAAASLEHPAAGSWTPADLRTVIQGTMPGRRAYSHLEVSVVNETPPAERLPLRGSHDIYSLMTDLQTADREKFVVLHLDNKHRLLCLDVVSVGSLTASIVHPREVLKTALLVNAAAIVLVHNHPSGDPTPSREDLEITRRIREACDILGLRVLDHVIVGQGRYVSFVDDGYW
jgi:DNA repair protein RadC